MGEGKGLDVGTSSSPAPLVQCSLMMDVGARIHIGWLFSFLFLVVFRRQECAGDLSALYQNPAPTLRMEAKQPTVYLAIRLADWWRRRDIAELTLCRRAVRP